MIYYVPKSLFDAPTSQLLVHACNCMGVWESGIAAQFIKLFYPESKLYNAHCMNYGKRLLGTSLILNRVGCLFTSKKYGKFVDEQDSILKNTELALLDLFDKTTMDIAMPRINSGLFRVPWELTEQVINKVISDNNRTIYVYTGEK